MYTCLAPRGHESKPHLQHEVPYTYILHPCNVLPGALPSLTKHTLAHAMHILPTDTKSFHLHDIGQVLD